MKRGCCKALFVTVDRVVVFVTQIAGARRAGVTELFTNTAGAGKTVIFYYYSRCIRVYVAVAAERLDHGR